MPNCMLLVAVALLVGTAVPARAQNVPTPSGCTYQTCGLRVEPRFFGMSLVRGSGGERVAKIGGFGGGVGVLLAGPDSAASHARSYVRANRTASTLILAAVLGYVVLTQRTNSFEHVDGADVAIAMGTSALLITSVPFALMS